MNRKVSVANLPSRAGEAEHNEFFSKAGSVMSVKIVKDRQTGQPKNGASGGDRHKHLVASMERSHDE
jgi:RNA recognition motif-containing protein